jgi:hypothetical protein
VVQLLAPEIKKERNTVLQCIRFLVRDIRHGDDDDDDDGAE